MKKTLSVASAMLFTIMLSSAAFAQVPAASLKTVVINSAVFNDPTVGITRLINANKALKAEFAPLENELQSMQTRLATLTKEIQDAARAGTQPQQAKIEQAELLERDMKRKADDGQVSFTRKTDSVLGPIYVDIGKAVEEFAKQKGVGLVFDRSRDQAGVLLMVAVEHDMTKQFIDFYNARSKTP